MNTLPDIRPFSKIRVTHGHLVADGTLKRLSQPDRFVIELLSSDVFNQTSLRIPITDKMLSSIELLPDGNFQLKY